MTKGDSRHSLLQRSLIGREGEGRDLVVVDLEVLQLYLLGLQLVVPSVSARRPRAAGTRVVIRLIASIYMERKDTCSDHQSYAERLTLKPTLHYNSKSQRYKE